MTLTFVFFRFLCNQKSAKTQIYLGWYSDDVSDWPSGCGFKNDFDMQYFQISSCGRSYQLAAEETVPNIQFSAALVALHFIPVSHSMGRSKFQTSVASLLANFFQKSHGRVSCCGCSTLWDLVNNETSCGNKANWKSRQPPTSLLPILSTNNGLTPASLVWAKGHKED